MSEDTLEPGSLEFKMNTAVLSMNRKLRDHGYSERERAAMWEMTVSEMREFLTKIWEHNHNDKNAERTAQLTATAAVKEIVDQQPDLDADEIKKIKIEELKKARIESINLVAEEPNPEAGVHPIEVKPTPPKPGPPVKATKPVQTS